MEKLIFKQNLAPNKMLLRFFLIFFVFISYFWNAANGEVCGKGARDDHTRVVLKSFEFMPLFETKHDFNGLVDE